MPKLPIRFLIVLIGVALFSASNAYTSNESAELSDAELKQLVKDLGSSKYSKREKATKKLIDTGYRAIKPLRRYLFKTKLTLEQKKRITKVLNTVAMPKHGFEWVGSDDETITVDGLKLGDLIIEINDKPVTAKSGIGLLLIDENGKKGKDRGKTKVKIWVGEPSCKRTKIAHIKFPVKKLKGFRRSCGVISRYLYSGHRGKWDKKVILALQGLDINRWDNTLRYGQEALNEGCRDATLYYAILWICKNMNDNPRFDYYKQIYQNKLIGNEDDHYGRAPGLYANRLLAKGKYKESRELYEQIIDKCKEEFAIYAHMEISQYIPEAYILESFKKGFEFACKNPTYTTNFRYSFCGIKTASFCERLSAKNPKYAIKFLKAARDKCSPDNVDFIEELISHYVDQSSLRAKSKKQPKLYPVLVYYKDAKTISRTDFDTYLCKPLPKMPLPGKLKIDMKFIRSHASFSPFRSGASFRMNTEGRSPKSTIKTEASGLVSTTMNYARYETSGGLIYYNVINYGKVDTYSTYSIAIKPTYIAYKVNKHCFRKVYFKKFDHQKNKPYCKPSISISHGDGSIGKIEYFAYSKIKVSNKKIRELLLKMRTAIKAGKFPEYKKLHKELAAIWAKVPEAKIALQRLNKNLDIYKKVFSKEGWTPSPRYLIAHYKKFIANTRMVPYPGWVVENDKLVFKGGYNPSASTLTKDIILPDAIEITNSFEIKNVDYDFLNRRKAKFFFMFNFNANRTLARGIITETGQAFFMVFPDGKYNVVFAKNKSLLTSEKSFIDKNNKYKIKWKMTTYPNDMCVMSINNLKPIHVPFIRDKTGSELSFRPTAAMRNQKYIFGDFNFKYNPNKYKKPNK